jgi:tetratricopeptide (TPR) repeat protein
MILNDEFSPVRPLGTILKIRISGNRGGSSRSWDKPEGALDKLHYLFRKEKWRIQNEFAHYLDLVKKAPGDTKARLKLAEIHQKRGEKQKAISEYLITAEIFSRKALYAQAMAVYKRIGKLDSTFYQVNLKMAEIYRKMGFLGDAFSQYTLIFQYYNRRGIKDKAQEIIGLMAELNPRKFMLEDKVQRYEEAVHESPEELFIPRMDLPENEKKEAFFDLGAELEKGEPMELERSNSISTEKLYGFEEIFKELKEADIPSAAYPNFNFNMGVACREMGFIDEAVEQFQIAFEKEQNPFEAAKLMGYCFRDKGWWHEARQSFERALKIEGISDEKIVEVKNELNLACRGQKKEEETLGFTNSASVEDEELRTLSCNSPRNKALTMGRDLRGWKELLT